MKISPLFMLTSSHAAAERGTREQGFALSPRQRLRITLGQKDLGCDALSLAVPLAERGGILLGEARDISDGLLEVEHEGGTVTMRLAEFVARRDVGHTLAETEVLEPRRLADMEVIDG